MALTGANRTSTVSYATEAGLFEQAGCPAVICGPGDIAQAHAADEFVSVAQLEACLKFLADLTGRTLRALTVLVQAELRRVEVVAGVAELAGHPHLAVDDHVGQILGRETGQQLLHALARAAAIGR